VAPPGGVRRLGPVDGGRGSARGGPPPSPPHQLEQTSRKETAMATLALRYARYALSYAAAAAAFGFELN
jgi:hypothetical protein